MFTDPGGCLLWGVVGRIVCWGRPFPVCLFWVRSFDLSFLLLSPMSSPLSFVLLLYFSGLLGSYLHMYIFTLGTPPL